jgi:hypothetical protein
MAAAAVSRKVLVPTWESEVIELFDELPRLVPAARLAVRRVLESLMSEHTLSTSEIRSTEGLLTTLGCTVKQGSGQTVLRHVRVRAEAESSAAGPGAIAAPSS